MSPCILAKERMKLENEKINKNVLHSEKCGT
jgi:hypothetical protein